MTLHDDAERLRALAGSVPVEAVADLGAQLETVGHAVAEILGGSEPVGVLRSLLTDVDSLAGALVQVHGLMERAADHHIDVRKFAVPNIATNAAPDRETDADRAGHASAQPGRTAAHSSNRHRW
jgi:hypothetical protein